MESKAELRRMLRTRLAAMSIEEREAATGRIARAIWSLPEMDKARNVLAYASLSTEVGTDGLLAEAWRRGMRVVLPRCGPGDERMTLHRTEGAEKLSVGRYGIREPADGCETVPTGEVDLALVPGLGWDRDRWRLGRGAGYYDRLLGSPDWRGLTIGLFYAAQEVEKVPRDPWDVPLDLIVTEREVVRR